MISERNTSIHIETYLEVLKIFTTGYTAFQINAKLHLPHMKRHTYRRADSGILIKNCP